MNFLTPAAFALALLLPIIVAMYLLKLRRTEQVIASVYLWQRMVRDLEANAPWQRLRRNLLLLLQLLFVLMLVLALARPFTWADGMGGQTAIFVVDTSASMAALDGSPTRLDEAKRQLHALVDGLPAGARSTLIEAGDRVRVVVSASEDRQRVHAGIDTLQTGAGGSDLAAALALAAAVAARQPGAEIAVLSDFAGAGLDELPPRLAPSVPVRPLVIGSRGDNGAISALSLRPAGEQVTAFVQVSNYGSSPMQRRLLLSVAPATAPGAHPAIFAAYDLAIPPGGQEIVVAGDLPADTVMVEAALAGEDALALDDRAWALLRNADPVAVTLVSEGNRFLETALSLLPGLAVTTVRPADYTVAEDGGPALTIFDGAVPAAPPPGNLFYIGPLQGTAFFSVTGTLDRPQPQPVDRADPLLAHVTLNEVGVLAAAQIPLPDWARPLIVDGAGEDATPLLFAGEQDGRRLAALAFDLRRSDLPLHVAFPLLLSNLVDWLAASGSAQIPAGLRPGEALRFSPPPAVDTVTITRPDGRVSRLLPQAGQIVFAETGALGLYAVAWHGVEQARFAVNLAAPQESNVLPGRLALAAASSPGTDGPGAPQARQEWWRWLAFLALALLVAEWIVYHRGSLVRLWHAQRSAEVGMRSAE